ncbi:chaperonin 10-like protein [Ilyonectria robusta]|uniref:chaperonin 10-like protein n=1 Tax=Ilyonectria robusta TaxID=1079257 RepID=UPI001E8D8FDB|nr:chaperonin 10-like protein [Ilyonectria robusta]KAH8652591.1 chaperonin 10-like protein [Ilyonectria robusta]
MSSRGFSGKEYSVYRSKDGAPSLVSVKIPDLKPHDILIRITHTGVCHTDLLYCQGGIPAALGHEGVGIVEAVGSLVTQFTVGDRAGGGFHRSACGHCKYCLSGRDIYCYGRVTFGEGDFDNGTFGTYYIGKETFLHKIPEGLASEHAAPLQCAGTTVYTALKATVTSEKRVGIFGIGGLGHLAIQYAAKMGAEVVVYSTTPSKESEARELGATEFHLIDEMFDKNASPIDVLVVAGSKYPNWEKVLVKEFLARDGTIVPLAAPVNGPLSLPANAMFFNGFHVFSSLVGSCGVHDEMLEFSARHNIKPIVQVFKHDGLASVQTIFERLEQNKVRYRAVLEM